MPTTAQNLRELHELHQRSKSIRDRMASGPKALAARQTNLAKRQTELDAAREALKKAKADAKNKEVQAQSIRGKVDELRVRLNSVKKQAEYDAIRNEIAHANNNASKIEDDVLEILSRAETQETELKSLEADVARLKQEVAALSSELEERAGQYEAQLTEIDVAIGAAEQIIPDDIRDQYRRVIKQRGADAMAPVEDNACHGCFVTVTSQIMNELINGHTLVFCMICGRILYLADEPANVLKRPSETSRGKSNERWTDDEVRILYRNRHRSLEHLRTLLPTRTHDAIELYLADMDREIRLGQSTLSKSAIEVVRQELASGAGQGT